MSSQWKLVPVEPTETMVINGFESEPDECFSDEEVWEQYQEMSGCQQAAFRAKLCWAAMLAAAPEAPVTNERSDKDYVIEHAEYMAKSADDVLAKFQAYGLALLAVDEGGDEGEGELLENIDSARGDLQESLVDLRSMVYEFRKRAAKSR
ncbi:MULTISPECIES: hypothetical protein [Pseudomonas]|jgi:hypothetical protein|uniref:Phage protein n=1 Tax=Pseudomonas fluorescens TaxID=294 RepID=A0A120G5I8_PSEFL|nr:MULTISPECIES: hypothetical protein [Pseudomonas]AOS74426.1 hypothetical protein BH711_10900 [Pseudomonas fluorescens]KAA6194143.1 hypothetical protein F3K52_16700 [Pseudomonas lactis]KRC97733.1 hypothetical protein ASE33_04135 [Pseudomonas sp. Root9]KWV69111.1 hypothetical protein PFL603g_06432 [Pseudomonas fluorescens]KWV69134.1 hypothetical protein PFL603g_06427 [Pseudomonas fluorescens]